MAPEDRTIPERTASLETKIDMFLAFQKERDEKRNSEITALNKKMDAANTYISEDSGKNKARAQMWGFASGAIASFLVNLFTGHSSS